MEAEFVVALLGGAGLAAPLAERTGVPVVATEPDDHLDVAAGLGGDDVLVVGLAAVPWPVLPDLHAQGSASLPAYTGVVSWHALPALLDRLAEVAAPAARAGAHVLITAPDPGPDTEPGDVVFLREVAEGIAQRIDLPSRSIAWRGDTRTPTAVDALTSLVEAHGRRDIVEVPVAPGSSADPALSATAEQLGVRLSCIDLGRATQLDLLTSVVRTVIGHEEDEFGPDDVLGIGDLPDAGDTDGGAVSADGGGTDDDAGDGSGRDVRDEPGDDGAPGGGRP